MIGMRFTVPAPPVASRPRGTFVASIDPAPPAIFTIDGNVTERWMGGVTFTSIGCTGLTRTEINCVYGDEFPGPDEFGDVLAFDAFTISEEVECSTIGISRGELDDIAALRMSTQASFQIAEELMEGGARDFDPLTPTVNPSLSSAATSVGIAAAAPFFDALYAVEVALADLLQGGMGIIHVPAPALTVMVGGGAAALENGIWYTPAGHIVIADGGNIGPEPDDFGGVADADDFWIYGSGLIVWTASQAYQTTPVEHERIDFSRNVYRSSLQRQAIFYFDPCAVVAARTNVADLGLHS